MSDFRFAQATAEYAHVQVADPPPRVAISVAVVLRCGVCGLPWARITDGMLVIESRHGGDVHVNAVTVAALAALAGDGFSLSDSDSEKR